MARRAAQVRRKGSAQTPPDPRRVWIGIGAGVVLIVALFVYGALQQEVRQEEAARALAGVEQFPSEGTEHVPEGTVINYQTDPPTSGPHYEGPAEPRFYDSPVPPGYLVHNLEHGHIVIYYDPERTSQEALDYVRGLTDRYRGTWDAVLAVPREDERYELILTAWQHRLQLETFDRDRVDAFIDRFRGRGPENPVR